MVRQFLGRTCFISNCWMGYKSHIGEIITEKYTFFSVSKNGELFEIWKKTISRLERPLDNKNYDCKKHFLPYKVLENCDTSLTSLRIG